MLTNGGDARVVGDGVQLYDEDAAGASMLTVAKTELLPSGTYLVRSRVDISKVLDVQNGAFINCANVQIFTSNDTGAQKWNVSKNSDGTYTFVNCRSKKALDVENGVAANGSNVQQYESNSTLAQRWVVDWNEKAGGYEFASALDSNYVLDLAGGSSIDGSNIQIYQRNGTAAQSFILTKASYVPTAEDIMLEKAQGYSSGTNYLILVNKGEHRVCVFSGYHNNWSLIQSWSCVVGKPSTPTPSGTFRTTGFKRPALTTDSRAIYCTQIHGGYFFHSILVSESELGNSLSHGCVRLPYSAANWIYTTIGAGTTVVIYG